MRAREKQRSGRTALLLAVASTFLLAGCPEQPTTTPPTVPTSAPATTVAPVGVAPALSFHDTPVPAETRVVVVGAGLAGLITAYKLRQTGVEVHVLEATDRIGGRVATARYPDGAQGEFGMQEVWQDNPLHSIAKDLGVKFEDEGAAENVYSSFVSEDAREKPSKPKLHWLAEGSQKDFFKTILTGPAAGQLDAALAAFEAWRTKAKDLRDRAIAKGLADPDVKRLQDVSFGDWFAEAKLPTGLADYLQMTFECELASSWTEYSALYGLLELGIFLDEAETFHAKAGNHAIIEALGRKLPGRITTSSRVVRLQLPDKDRPGKGEIIVEYMRDGRISTVRADRVVMAVPWFRLHEIDIHPPLSAAKTASLEGLNRGQYVVVHFIVDKKEGDKLWRDAAGRSPFPVLSTGPLGVIYGVRGEGDPGGTTDVFGLLVYGKPARRLHMKTTREVEQMAVPELERIWPGFGKVLRATYVYSYHPGAIPVWPVGRSPIDDHAKALFQPEHGLFLAGDYLISAHSDGAVRSGLCVSERVAKDLGGEPFSTGLCHYAPPAKP